MYISQLSVNELDNGLIGIEEGNRHDERLLKYLLCDYSHGCFEKLKYDTASDKWLLKSSFFPHLTYRCFWSHINFGVRRCDVGFGDAVLNFSVSRLLYCLQSDLQLKYLMAVIVENFYVKLSVPQDEDGFWIFFVEEYQGMLGSNK